MTGQLMISLLAVTALNVPASAADPRTFTVELTDAPPYMHPVSLRVRVGDTVVFRNRGPEMLHVMSDDGLTLFSGDIAVGAEWRYTFTRPGVYPYVCHRHHFMRGSISVEDSQGRTRAPPDYPYQPAFREFVVPTMQAVPRMIVASNVDDTMWFTEGGGDFYGFENIPANNKIGNIDERGRIVEYATPTSDGDGSKIGVDSLVMGENGAIWFTERLANRIGRLLPGRGIQEFPLATTTGSVLGIDRDRVGNLWFAERFGNRIGRLDRRGQLKAITLPQPDSEPRTVFVDRAQRVWYTARSANEIGNYDPRAGRFTRLTIPTPNARPTGIAQTSDGTIYFVEMVGNKIGKVVGKQIVEYALPTKFAAAFKIVADSKDILWFTEVFGNAIGRMDPRTGEIREYKIPTPDSRPGGITLDRKGRIWFTEQLGNKIGMFDPAELLRLERETASHDRPPAKPVAPPSGPFEIRDFQLPSAGSGPGNDVVEDADGVLWFPEIHGNRIGSFDVRTGRFEELTLPSPASMPAGLAMDRAGILWVAQFRTGSLARVDPASRSVQEFPLPRDAALPTSVAIDERGRVWLTELGANRIARFDQRTRSFQEFVMPRESSSPLHVAADKRGALWITASEESGNYLARFDLEKESFRCFDLPTPNSSPVASLPDRTSVWVTEGGAGKLARLDLGSFRWEEFPIPGTDAQPVRLAKDGTGRIWVTDGGGLGGVGGNRLVVFDPQRRSFQLIPMKLKGAKPRGILAARDGTIWFTQQGANRLSKISQGG
jgi:streptogramin lyase/plastocyanin